MSTLDRIRLSGFKSIATMDLELRPLNVLIGANGAGKSNLIQAFALLNAMVEGRLQTFVARAGGAHTLLHFGRKTTDRIAIGLAFGPNGYEATLAAAADDTLFFSGEQCTFHDRARYPTLHVVDLGSGHRESWPACYAVLQPRLRYSWRPSRYRWSTNSRLMRSWW